MNNITLVAGARPNFVKIAPIIKEIKKRKLEGVDINYKLVHTGQHYDINMSGDFFDQLNIPKPDINLKAHGGTQGQQTANIILGFEKYLSKNPTELVIVVGDVTSTMACAITAQKMGIKVAHIEGGIRSNDWSMPEEINRLITDSISNYFFTTSKTANDNLIFSGHSKEKIFFVGNTMIDSLIEQKKFFIKPPIWDKLKLKSQNYLVVTLHRPANVDQQNLLKETINQIILSSQNIPVIFPMHPRTFQVFKKLNIDFKNLFIVDPLSYLEFNYLVKNSKAVITDSGGITEETTVLGIPCMTLRDNTERPETITIGTNELIGTNPKLIKPAMKKLFSNNWKRGSIPELWDGKTSQRIIDIIIDL